jgi:uncharacterized protein (DUF934 family)
MISLDDPLADAVRKVLAAHLASGSEHNLRRGHYELGIEAAPKHRLADVFHELALAILNFGVIRDFRGWRGGAVGLRSGSRWRF